MSDTVLVYRGDEIAAYGFGDPHPFGTDRHDVFHSELDKAGLEDSIDYGHPRPALVDELVLFHTAEYIDKVSRLSAEGKGWLDEGDTPAVPGIYDAASAVVGAVLCAVDEIMHGNYKRAFIPIAGLHHAGRGHAAGFCVFNDCGIAAEYLRKEFGVRRIAYVDIDAHHGDGMFYGFEDDPDLIFADIHEDDIPVAPGSDDADFHSVWPRIEEYLEAAKPEFIIMQCGADSLKGDPITHLCWTEEAHATAAASLCRVADKYCEGRIIGTGGGGYNRRNIARAWTRVVDSFVKSSVSTS